jgi:Na+(H+)/acetate symporter ActP
LAVQIIMLAAFVAVMLYIGLYSRRKATSLKDFYLAGRNLGPWLSSFAFGTTYFSAVIFVGYAGTIGWNYGMGALLIAFGNAFIGGMLAWLLLAKRARHDAKIGCGNDAKFSRKAVRVKAFQARGGFNYLCIPCAVYRKRLYRNRTSFQSDF